MQIDLENNIAIILKSTDSNISSFWETFQKTYQDFIQKSVSFNLKAFDFPDFYLSLFPELAIRLIASRNLKIQPYKKHCRSCIITELEVIEMAEQFYNELYDVLYKSHKELAKNYSSFVKFSKTEIGVKKAFSECVYSIPIVLKKLGFELIRPSESEFIDQQIAEKLARVIHANYMNAMKANSKSSFELYANFFNAKNKQIPLNFDELEEDYKLSNIDFAYHIPIKLLSIGYKISPVKNEELEIPYLQLTDTEIEIMSKIEHDRWCCERRLNGWTYGKTRNNEQKHHPSLLPFDELTDDDREKNRVLTRLIPVLLKDMAYVATPISPEFSEKIPYMQRDFGMITQLSTEISLLKAEMIKLQQSDVLNRLGNIESLTNQIKESFMAGKSVQANYLPSILSFKEYLPNSFVLYKPKDTVSGDFYFVSKLDSQLIFLAADCTGHGIPASVLTAVCFNFLDIAINKNKLTNPAEILTQVFNQIEIFLQHQEKSFSEKLGMDISICSLNEENLQLQFSGIGNSLFYIENGELKELKAISSLGFNLKTEKIVSHEIQLKKGDFLYLFSDGYKDQEGGESNKKLCSKRFKSILNEVQNLAAQEQCEILNSHIENWRKTLDINKPQDDDILVIGVKV